MEREICHEQEILHRLASLAHCKFATSFLPTQVPFRHFDCADCENARPPSLRATRRNATNRCPLSPGAWLRIWGVYVAPEFRRRSVGRQLVARALQHSFSLRGVRQVNLSVNAANGPAIALYKAAGFQSFGVERGYLLVNGVLEDEMHMVCLRGDRNA